MQQSYMYIGYGILKDFDTIIDEVSAVLDKQSLLELYHIATSEPYLFLNVKFMVKAKNEMFYQKITRGSK